MYTIAGKKMIYEYNSGQGCKVTHRDRIKSRQRNWWELAFVDFSWGGGWQKHVRIHCHAVRCFDTSVSPRSKGNGGVMCDTNEQEPHWYPPCSNEREQCILLLFTFSEIVCVRNRERQKDQKEKNKKDNILGVSSTCFQLNRYRKRAIFKNSTPKKQVCLSYLELTFVTKNWTSL